MKEIKTPKGVLKYRYPTVMENISITRLIRSGIIENDLIEAKLKLVEHIKDYLDYSDLEGINSFEDLNKHGEEMTAPLFLIAGEILEKVLDAFAKKN